MFWKADMRLNQASDFALRVLMLLATKKEPATIDVISSELGLVKSHIMKIVAKLRHAGFVDSQRGRLGGVTLARPADEISVGKVVRAIEADFAVVECMQEGKSGCTFLPQCKLRHTIHAATGAFLKVLDEKTLRDVLVS
jgi:Rrf2 family nitric oxide-sensitive transcriptional repressor